MMTYLIIGLTVITSFICFQDREKFVRMALIPYRIRRYNEWYRMVSHGFVHADTMHLLVNMFTFWSFGEYIESLFTYAGLGKWAFLLLYFGGMIISSLYDVIKRKDDSSYMSIGASGAVSAVLFAAIFFDPWGKIYFFAFLPIPGILFGVIYLFYCQYMAKKSVDNINHNAHFYGAVFGFLFPLLLKPEWIHMFVNNFFSF